MSLNLAGRPFVNRRPVQRISVLVWGLGLVVAVVNGFLYWGYFSGQGVTETDFQEAVSQLEAEHELLARAREQLGDLEAGELNSKVEFVNLRIQQRTFSWSKLFDVFAATLPDDVRLLSLTPRFEEARRRGTSRSTGRLDEAVRVEIQGQAKSSQALLEFLDRLFAHPAFENPDLHREQTRSDSGSIDFSISTGYLANANDADSPGSDANEVDLDDEEVVAR